LLKNILQTQLQIAIRRACVVCSWSD